MKIPACVQSVVLLGLLSGCSALPPGAAGHAPPPPLKGVEWVVEDIDGKGVVDRSRATLNFDGEAGGGRVTGSGSCNSYTGPYTQNGDALSFGNLASTRRACPQALMEQEQRFFDTLSKVQRFELAPDGALLLRGEPGRFIKARRA
jgi:heat shock protein HslJ